MPSIPSVGTSVATSSPGASVRKLRWTGSSSGDAGHVGGILPDLDS